MSVVDCTSLADLFVFLARQLLDLPVFHLDRDVIYPPLLFSGATSFSATRLCNTLI